MVEPSRRDVVLRPFGPRHPLARGLARGLFVLALFVITPAAQAQPDRFAPRQLIVKLEPSTPSADAFALRASVGARVERRFPTIGAELWEITGIGVPDAVARLKSSRRVVYAEPNYIVHAEDVPDDPRFEQQWALHNIGQTGGLIDADIDAPEAWTFETGGDVLVGVIDSGVDWDHADLAANIFVNPGEVADNHLDDDQNGFIDDVHGWDFLNEDNDPDDDNGHGTHVAGILAAVGNNGVGIAGVAWSARILPLKFLSAIGTGSTSDAIRAVEYATAMGARLTNNSWGGISFSQALRDAIEAAGEANVLFVAASGNNASNNDAFAHYPSGFDLPNLISVLASDHNDTRSVFSNYGAVSVDLAAPGSDIISTFPGDRYVSASGTSMAAPQVSGAVCLLWSAAPTLTYQEVRDAILDSVDKIPALQNVTATGGRLNLDRMMSQLDDIPPAAITDLVVQSTGSSTARLTWTASGDDGDARTASRYDLRYATVPIDAGNFDTATPASGVASPQVAGSAESFEVSGLEFNTAYYFALVVEDERANRSPVSNSPSATTLGPPRIEYDPASFSAALPTGGQSTQNLEIRNTAEGTLDFSTVDPLPSWLRVEPPAGRVIAGASTDVAVRIDATRLAGGSYAATIELRTNDAEHRTVAIPVALQVTSAPDIAASPAEIDFGVRFTGTCTTDTVVVTNIGAEPLVVSEVQLANPDFSTDPAGFVLQPEEERALFVQFCPQAEEMVPGIPRQYPRPSQARLVLVSNDPDHAEFSIPIFGEAVDPPVIEVSPPSLAAELVTGAASTQTLTIANHGASNLDIEISLEELGGTARVEVVGAPAHEAGGIVAVGRPLSAHELLSLPLSLPSTVSVGNVDRMEPSRRPPSRRQLEIVDREIVDGEIFGSDENEFLGGPRTRGNVFRCTTPTTLLEHRFYMGPTTATRVWFMVYEGEEQTGVYNLVSASDVSPAGPGLGWYSSGAVSVPIRAGKFYLIATSFEDATVYYNEQNIAPYPIPASFGELAGAAGWTWQPYDQIPPAPLQFVTADAFTEPVAYYQALVTGSAVRWLALDAEAATLAPGASLEVAVRFDATGLAGGEYDGLVRVTSNDPHTPQVVVPARASITGAADIAVSPASLDFGTAFVGTSVQDTLVVSNTGTEFLLVTGLSFDRPGYAADATAFPLAPGTRRLVIVTFAPTAAGSFAGNLSIASNDPDEPSFSVTLDAAALEPPVVSVTPVSFDVGLMSGQTGTQVMTITNSGASPLEYEIATATSAAAAPRPHVSVPRSAGDFPRGVPAPSIGAAPTARGERVPDQPLAAPSSPAGFAFATETQNRQAVRLRLDSPERLELFGSAPNFIWAGDFGVGDNSFAYAVDELNHFVKIDTLSGAQTDLGTLAPIVGEVWSGMALDPTDGTMYAVSTDARQSSLYTIDVKAPSATRIGRIFSPAIVALAVDDDGRIYGLDVINDELVAIDKSTAVGTPIGSLGYDANFGHGMAFDPSSEQLLVSAFNNFRFQSELRIADRSTGATVLVGVLGGLEPGGLVQLGWLGIPGLGGVPWLRANPRRGVVPPGSSVDVTVQFDARDLIAGTYDAEMQVTSNDPHAPSILVPARSRVDGEPEIAFSDSLIEFGPVFVGGTSTRVLTVSNVGTESLEVTKVTASGDFSVDETTFTLAPAETRGVVVILRPSLVGDRSGELVLTSNDADEAAMLVLLRGDGRAPPVMTVTPGSFDESLATGQRVTRRMTIDNTRGAADLIWNAASRYAADARAVAAASPVFSSRAIVDPLKDAPRRPSERPRPEDRYTFAVPAATSSAAAPAASSLETILASLDARHPWVTAVIPERWNFFDGTLSDAILDGGYDMFDGGNYLSTNFGGTIMYSDGVIVDSDYFGAGGRYFTRKYPGLFVLVAEMNGVDYFEIAGNLGADGTGLVDGAVLSARASGADFKGFVKRVYGAQEDDPSVNHMIIVQENDAASHEFATDTNSDYHRAFNLGGGRRLYYLLYSGWQGAYIDNAAALNIMAAFLEALGLSPSWARVTPGAGVIPAGASAGVDIVFDAAGVEGSFDAHVVVAGNDPLAPEVVVPARLQVSAAPDIALSANVLRFDPLFVGAIATDSVHVANAGTDTLRVSAVSSPLPDYVIDRTTFSLAPAETLTLAISFRPTLTGSRVSALSIQSNDPDEASATLLVIGEGLPAPVVAVAPSSLADTLAAGEVSAQTFTVRNAGGSMLDVVLSIAGARDGSAADIGGGPDFADYRWEDNTEAGGPALDWIDAAAGTDIVLSNDGFEGNIPLGFSFRYYGTPFESIGVGANGWLSFTGSGSAFPLAVPAADFFAGAIAPYALDLNAAEASYVRYLTTGTAPDRRFVVEYHDVPLAGSSERATFEAVFYERTNAIRFQYLQAPRAPAGLGIESPDETIGLGNGGEGVTHIEAARVADGYAIEFLAPPAWLRIDAGGASIPEGSSADFSVTFDAGGLADAHYYGRLLLRTNDPATPALIVPVELAVQPRHTAGPGTKTVPARYALHNNRPNPFNPSTTIAYDLPRPSRVTVTIYDVRGREVRTLVSGALPAGEHRVEWDGRDAQRQPAASGVYFCRLTAEGFVQTKKMVLLK